MTAVYPIAVHVDSTFSEDYHIPPEQDTQGVWGDTLHGQSSSYVTLRVDRISVNMHSMPQVLGPILDPDARQPPNLDGNASRPYNWK